MVNLARLFAAVRAINPGAEIRFVQVPDHNDMWVIRVLVGDIILVETGGGLPPVVVQETIRRLESMSLRILQAVRNTDPE